MTPEEYDCGIGRLIARLRSFEFGLRLFLWNQRGPTSWSFVNELLAGQTVEENAFTSYDTLGQLITKYNATVKASAPELQVDPGLSDLRDLLGHGRMFSNEPVSPLRVMKFSHAVRGTVTVTHAVLVDSA